MEKTIVSESWIEIIRLIIVIVAAFASIALENGSVQLSFVMLMQQCSFHFALFSSEH